MVLLLVVGKEHLMGNHPMEHLLVVRNHQA